MQKVRPNKEGKKRKNDLETRSQELNTKLVMTQAIIPIQIGSYSSLATSTFPYKRFGVSS